MIRATLPHLQNLISADLFGFSTGALRPRGGTRLLLSGFSPPPGKPFRIWHARRNIDMAVGLVLRFLLGWPLRFVFTLAGQRRFTPFTYWLIRRAEAVIATSEQTAAFLPTPTTVIPHGIDCDVFRPAPDRAAAWQARGLTGLHGIGVFGRVRPQKGTDLFVEALVTLLPHHPEFTGIVIGRCKVEDGAFLSDLKSKVAAAGLSDRILFLGEASPDVLPLWIASVSICVAPQRHEGFGLVPLEAAACGTPVVATRAGAAGLIVDDEQTGLLVPTDDGPALTQAIERLMASASLRDRMGPAARRRALAEFAITKEVERYMAVYGTVWARAGAAALPQAEAR